VARHSDASSLALEKDATDREAEPDARHVGAPCTAASIEPLEQMRQLVRWNARARTEMATTAVPASGVT
jgi:hypothetical protein